MAQLSSDHLENSMDKVLRQNPSDIKGGLHEMRKSIDALVRWADILRKNKDFGREMSLVHTKLQEAKMWTGKCLEQTGNKLPEEYRDKAEGTNL